MGNNPHDPTTKSTYGAGLFALELDGQLVGYLSSVEGGEVFAEVRGDVPDATGVVKKQVGGPKFAPIRMSFGLGMAQPLYQWVADFLRRHASPKNGAIVFLDYARVEQSRIEFDQALITELTFPALDAASTAAVYFTLALQPAATRISTASIGIQVPAFGLANQPPSTRLLAANFRLKIAGLEAPCKWLNGVDAIIVNQASGVLNVPNVTFTLPESQGMAFYDWFKDFVLTGHNADQYERTGTLELFDRKMQTSYFTLTLSQIGICGIRKERKASGAAVTEHLRVEVYCEQMAFASTVVSQGSTPTIVSGAVSPAAPHIGVLPGMTSPHLTVQPQLIAQRLLAPVRPLGALPSVSQRDDGISIGARWASENATLDELEQVAALETAEWTAMNLNGEHSLLAQLREAGTIPADRDGALDLERDPFVEGIVAGAVQVFRTVVPHLTSPPNVGSLSNMEGLEHKLNGLATSAQLASLEPNGQGGDDADLANVELQNLLQTQQQALQTLSTMSKMLHDTASEVFQAIKRIGEIDTSFNEQYLQLQNQMQDESRRFTLLSNLMKTKHDTAKTSISNIR